MVFVSNMVFDRLSPSSMGLSVGMIVWCTSMCCFRAIVQRDAGWVARANADTCHDDRGRVLP